MAMALMTQTRDPAATPIGMDGPDARRAAEGDMQAFERLYRRHVARIHTLARRMLGEADADEATQDVFVRAWEKLGTFRGDAAFGTWLYRVGINVLLARRASLVRRRERFTGDDAAIDRVSVRPVRTDLRIDFDAAIDRLPDGAREVFTLYDIEGYKHEEIAGMLGISAGTSKSQLHRARMLLRAHLKE